MFRKRPELEKKFLDYDIILISETWLTDCDRFLIKNFDTIKTCRSDRRGGGVAIFVKHGIEYQLVNNLYLANKKIEVCAINLSIKGEEMTIVSLCKPPDMAISPMEWQQFFTQFTKKVFIGGDFNAHHPLWGGSITCTEGKKLFNSVVDLEFYCLNNGSAIRFSTPFSQETAIDISFTNSPKIISAHWEVLENSWGSDHLPIRIEIMGVSCNQTRFPNSYRIYNTKTDWSAAITELETNIPLCEKLVRNNSIDIQTKYSSFMATIESCIRNHIPCKKIDPYNGVKLKSNPWWNEKCNKLVRPRRAAYLKFKFCHTRELFLKYKQADEKAKGFFRKRKKESFLEFCSSLSRFSNIGYVWHKIRAMGNKYHRKETANSYKPNLINIINQQIEELSAPCLNSNPVEILFNLQNEDPITYEEVHLSINSSKPKSSPGPDGIDYRILRILPKELIECLVHIFNEILTTGNFLHEWKKFGVLFIPKKDSEKFRPISLAQCTLKVLERIIKDRLYYWLESNHLLPVSQYGFKAKRSCHDNLAIISAKILANSYENKERCALFLDIQGAYDNVVCDIMIHKLTQLNLPKIFIYFIYNLISNREVQFRFNEIDRLEIINKGLPQGSILSPLLYSLYVADLKNCTYNLPSIKYLQFADDICVYCSDYSTRQALDTLEQAANIMDNWLEDIGLKIAPNKSQLCVFRKIPYRNQANIESIQIRNITINARPTVKFLGITFQNNMKRNKHFDNISANYIKPLNIIKFQ